MTHRGRPHFCKRELRGYPLERGPGRTCKGGSSFQGLLRPEQPPENWDGGVGFCTPEMIKVELGYGRLRSCSRLTDHRPDYLLQALT